MFSVRARIQMPAPTCVLLSLTCASSPRPNGITECPAPKASFRCCDSETSKLYHSSDFHDVLLSNCALPSPLEKQLILIFSDMLSWWQYSVIRLHLVCFLFASFSNLLRAMRHQYKKWQNVWTNSSKLMLPSGKMLRSDYFWPPHCAWTSYY